MGNKYRLNNTDVCFDLAICEGCEEWTCNSTNCQTRPCRKKEEQYIERVGELDNVMEIRNQQRDLCEEI